MSEEKIVTTESTSVNSATSGDDTIESTLTDNENNNKNNNNQQTTSVETKEKEQSARELKEDENGVLKITENGSVTKRIITKNADGSKPHILGRIWINIKGETNDGSIIFEDSLFEEIDFILGQAEHCRGIEMSLSTMNIGEHAIITINDPEFSYPSLKRPKLCPEDKTEDNKHLWPLKFTVILIDSMAKQKMSHEMTFLEQYNYANILRIKGNDRYKKKRLLTAIKLYKKSLQCLEAMKDNNIGALKETKELESINEDNIKQSKINVYSNISICYLRLKEWGLGAEYATNAINLDSNCIKGLIRRGICYREQGKYDDSQKDFDKYLSLIDINDNNGQDYKVGKKQIKLLNKARKKAKEQIEQTFGGFLKKDNFQLYNDKKEKGDTSHGSGGGGVFGNDEDDSWLSMVTAPCVAAMTGIYQLALSCCGKKKRD